ncbi:hypothetical protein Srot_0886 [Segniliparus rotundus DSM 44985]|uniref:Uncharacterized protein n=1 Tax=Segniliparus rotundus (strain ATCC BAA-972 / CDC 1076 / CIP 108378 / DSM 44985 / JCM 13578) TaxID=640132 RepID=D6ZE83_SEGRD|nr:hypothetical protein [Segniliparus rotundus]ADG97363.1 hypothetical protein Srot_0886 [Segniliparus rotundus DSM 44985]
MIQHLHGPDCPCSSAFNALTRAGVEFEGIPPQEAAILLAGRETPTGGEAA